MDDSLDHVAAGIIKVLLEITDCSASTNETATQPAIFSPWSNLAVNLTKIFTHVGPCIREESSTFENIFTVPYQTYLLFHSNKL